MILVNFFIAFFAIFMSPQIILYYKYNDLKYSLLLTYGLIISFSASWILFLITFYFNIGHTFLYLISIIVVIYTLYYMYSHQATKNHKIYLIWLLVFIIMLPLLQHVGEGFRSYDAVVSWNRWALELANNTYHPMNAAYPILLPSLWSLIYKIQGTSEIWWTAQITLFTIPFFTLAILLTLYREYKDKTFIFILIFLYPYLIWEKVINGYMDMPVMLMGTLSLILLYAAEINKEKKDFEYYIVAALLLAGIASIIKQAGLIFLIFTYLYILLHLKYFENKKRILLYSFLVPLYFISFLLLYYQYQSDVTGNLEILKSVSSQKAFDGKTIYQTVLYLARGFFRYPPNVPYINIIIQPLELSHTLIITPILVMIGLLLFSIKKLRNYRSLNFLSTIFFLLGVIIWIKFFSYDSRNSYWVKSFFIIFLSINVNYFFSNYLQRVKPKNIFLIIVVFTAGYLYILGDSFAYKKQNHTQGKVGSNARGKLMMDLLRDKNNCLVIYTNAQPDKYNYYAKEIFDRIITFGRVREVSPYYEHTCTDGRYFMFIRRGMSDQQEEWKKVLALEKNGTLKQIRKTKRTILYFAAPKKLETI